MQFDLHFPFPVSEQRQVGIGAVKIHVQRLEARVELPGSKPLWVLLNHFKSKGYGPPEKSDARRKLQAQAVAQILERFDLANDLVCVMGDLNDTPAGKPLAPLLQSGLVDVLERQFPNPSDRWTYSKPKSQIDYLLCSPALMERFTRAGIERRGLYDAARLTNNAVAPFPSALSVKVTETPIPVGITEQGDGVEAYVAEDGRSFMPPS